MNNIQAALVLLALLAFSGGWAAVSDPAGSDDCGRAKTNSSMTLEVGTSPDYEIGSDYVQFVYKIHNTGTLKLCNIVINNSLPGVTPLDPFDLEPGGNSTLIVEYYITAEDRELPYSGERSESRGSQL